MSTKIKYTDEALGEVKVISDFLPSLEELAFKEDTVKVTISLSKSSVDFFKREVKRLLAIRVSFPVEDPDNATTSGNGLFDLRTFDVYTVSTLLRLRGHQVVQHLAHL